MTVASVEVVPCDTAGTVTVTAALTHMCPHRAERDHGTVTITWAVDGATIELHSLRAWLDGFADEKVSHEELTAQILHALDGLSGQGVHVKDVRSDWTTAGMTVRVVAD